MHFALDEPIAKMETMNPAIKWQVQVFEIDYDPRYFVISFLSA